MPVGTITGRVTGRVTGGISSFGNAAASFDPLSLSPHAWYDFTDLTTLFQDSLKTTPVTATGQPIGAVVDKSGNSRDANTTVTAAKPIYTTGEVGGLSAAIADGIDDYLQSTGWPISQPYEEWVVLKQVSVTNGSYISDSAAFGGSSLRQKTFPADSIDANSGLILNSNTFGTGVYKLLRIVRNGASSSITINNGTPVVGNMGTAGINGMILFSRYTGGTNSNTARAETLVVPALSAQQEADMVGYFNKKYGWAL